MHPRQRVLTPKLFSLEGVCTTLTLFGNSSGRTSRSTFPAADRMTWRFFRGMAPFQTPRGEGGGIRKRRALRVLPERVAGVFFQREFRAATFASRRSAKHSSENHGLHSGEALVPCVELLVAQDQCRRRRTRVRAHCASFFQIIAPPRLAIIVNPRFSPDHFAKRG